VQDRYTYNERLIGNHIWPMKWQQRQWLWRSFTGCRPFQMQFVEHLCSILHDVNWQHACTVLCVSRASCLLGCECVRLVLYTAKYSVAGERSRWDFDDCLTEGQSWIADHVNCQMEPYSLLHSVGVGTRYNLDQDTITWVECQNRRPKSTLLLWFLT